MDNNYDLLSNHNIRGWHSVPPNLLHPNPNPPCHNYNAYRISRHCLTLTTLQPDYCTHET